MLIVQNYVIQPEKSSIALVSVVVPEVLVPAV